MSSKNPVATSSRNPTLGIKGPSAIRNIAVIAHAGAGKTSLIESMLYKSGAIKQKGNVEQGKAAMLTEPEEIQHHLAVTIHLGHLEWKNHAIYFVDTPGSFNFLESTRGVLPGIDGALFLFTGTEGVKPETERLWGMLEEAGIPCLGFINQIDDEQANLNTALSVIEQTLKRPVEPLSFPIRHKKQLIGVVDLLARKTRIVEGAKETIISTPDAMGEELLRARTHLVERIAENDDALLERYLAGETIPFEELLESLRTACFERKFVPVLCGSGKTDIGVSLLLDFLVECLPSPMARDTLRPVKGHAMGHEEQVLTRSCKTEEPFSAQVLKTTVDPFFGKLSIVRVFSGQVKSNQQLLNSSRNMRQKAGHTYLLQGKELAQVQVLSAGEIGAIAKLDDTHTGETVCEPEQAIVYPHVQFAEPAVRFAVETGSKDDDKVSAALMKLADEDPSLHFYRDEATHQLILAGMGQTHIEVTLERLERKFGAHATLKAPKVPYRETIQSSAKAQGKLKKQTGGHGQFANTWIELTPLARGSGFEFVDNIVGGVIPKQYIPSVRKGVQEAMQKGGLGGYPVVDVRVTLYDGSFHDVDSSDYAFQVAGSLGFKAAYQEASPVLLEPIMSVRVVVPEECAGAAIKDLTSRRGKILGLDGRGTAKEIQAEVPLAEMLDYGRVLGGLTSGRGTYTMHTSGYQEVPFHLKGHVLEESTEQLAAV